MLSNFGEGVKKTRRIACSQHKCFSQNKLTLLPFLSYSFTPEMWDTEHIRYPRGASLLGVTFSWFNKLKWMWIRSLIYWVFDSVVCFRINFKLTHLTASKNAYNSCQVFFYRYFVTLFNASISINNLILQLSMLSTSSV